MLESDGKHEVKVNYVNTEMDCKLIKFGNYNAMQ